MRGVLYWAVRVWWSMAQLTILPAWLGRTGDPVASVLII